jgi:hypothetical protein
MGWAIVRTTFAGLVGYILVRAILYALNSKGYHPEVPLGRMIGHIIPAKNKVTSNPWILAGIFGLVVVGGWYVGYETEWLKRLLWPEAAQPDIILLQPTHTYRLTWNASSNLEIVILPSRRPEEAEPLKTGLPVFPIKNLGSEVAKSVSIEWDAKDIDFRTAIHNSDRLKPFTVKLSSTTFGIYSGAPDPSKVEDAMNIANRGIISGSGYGGYFGSYSQDMTTQLPYMAREINNTSYQEAILPLQITHVLELFIVATMPEAEPSSTRLPMPPIFATVRWQKPENGKPLRYRIDAAVLNLKPWASINHKVVSTGPDIEADVQFTVTPLGK